MKPIFIENQKYTFKDYFEFSHPIEEIVAELGYSYSLGMINLPLCKDINVEAIRLLQSNYYKVLPKINLNSESAKREFLIAPILFEVAKVTDAKISLEYPLNIDDKLSGYLDYFIRSKQALIIIEAKKGDIDRGFNQLSAELIALDKYEEEGNLFLYGAITIGEMWIFSILDRKSKHITKNIHSYTIPEDVETLFNILVGIVNVYE